MVQLGAAALHILWCRLFVDLFSPELRGLAAADVVTYMLQFFVLAIYAQCAPSLAETSRARHPKPIGDWSDFLKTAVPKAVYFWAQSGAWALLIILAGLLLSYQY